MERWGNWDRRNAPQLFDEWKLVTVPSCLQFFSNSSSGLNCSKGWVNTTACACNLTLRITFMFMSTRSDRTKWFTLDGGRVAGLGLLEVAKPKPIVSGYGSGQHMDILPISGFESSLADSRQHRL
jgi:hypothetical protein